MRRWWAVSALLLAGCPPEAAGPGCLDDPPAKLGESCAGDGECGNWLVCAATCVAPPAVAGEGGEVLRLTGLGTDSRLNVEVARGDLQRSRGLGYRPCISEGWGMMLEFPDAADHLITTRTMQFDLDIAMAGDDRVFHTVFLGARAGDETLLGGTGSTRYVLEIPAGELPIEPGIRFEYE